LRIFVSFRQQHTRPFLGKGDVSGHASTSKHAVLPRAQRGFGAAAFNERGTGASAEID
jgi:hypothetical protein